MKEGRIDGVEGLKEGMMKERMRGWIKANMDTWQYGLMNRVIGDEGREG